MCLCESVDETFTLKALKKLHSTCVLVLLIWLMSQGIHGLPGLPGPCGKPGIQVFSTHDLNLSLSRDKDCKVDL